ncbi:DUF1266 domain-containing protein [Streptomyces sp. NPDC008313]|uniref:DUF1266 domain-containing protein n=1 Tax=Streptomyces sp. NPDC008313 TaxID=3364826 RepID=UPI0036E37FBA
MRGDWAGYYATLAKTRLYFQVHRDKVDADPDFYYPHDAHDPRTGARWRVVFTDGMLPAPQPDLVFAQVSLFWLSGDWNAHRPPTLVINPGSPSEAVLPYGPPHSTEWSQIAQRLGDQSFGMRLRGLAIGGVLHGPVAHGLACGALLCVNNGSLWNTLAWHGSGYQGERTRLREWWGITTREQWQHHLRSLLACEASSPVWEFALRLRRSIARDFGGHVDVGYWRQAVGDVLRGRPEGSVVLTPEGVSKTEPRSGPAIDAQIEGVQRLIGRITRYEARMRADGVLDENRYVTSVDAWDLGRASKMARWGLGARFGTMQEAEAAVVQAGRTASLSYRSWQDFSAGYILGRCLHFDDEEFGDWYETMASAHRILMSDPGSPWLNLPFQ